MWHSCSQIIVISGMCQWLTIRPQHRFMDKQGFSHLRLRMLQAIHLQIQVLTRVLEKRTERRSVRWPSLRGGGCCAGVGVTKVPLVDLFVNKMFDLAQGTARFVESHSYSTGVIAASNATWYSIGNARFNSAEQVGKSRNGGNWHSNPNHWTDEIHRNESRPLLVWQIVGRDTF